MLLVYWWSKLVKHPVREVLRKRKEEQTQFSRHLMVPFHVGSQEVLSLLPKEEPLFVPRVQKRIEHESATQISIV